MAVHDGAETEASKYAPDPNPATVRTLDLWPKVNVPKKKESIRLLHKMLNMSRVVVGGRRGIVSLQLR